MLIPESYTPVLAQRLHLQHLRSSSDADVDAGVLRKLVSRKERPEVPDVEQRRSRTSIFHVT